MRTLLTVSLLLAMATSAAATPPETASGLYYVGSDDTPATLVFEVLPWTADVHQVRGYGRAVVGKEDPRELHFEIIGTYRPTRNQTARGMFVQRSADGSQTATIPWQGLYVPKDGSFQWLATVDGQLVPLPAAQFSGVSPKNAAAKPATSKTASGAGSGAAPSTAATVVADPNGPSRASIASDPVSNNAPAAGAGSANAQGTPVALFAKYPTLELVKEIDLGKVVTDALAGVPSKPRVYKPQSVDGTLGLVNADPAGAATADFINGVAGLLRDQPPPAATATPSATATSGTPAVTAAPATSNSPPAAPTNPAPSSPPTTTPPPSAPAGRTVPNVVGLSFENATNAIWAAGLTVGGVDVLGAAQDPAKAERIIFQAPPAGSPVPADRRVRLQWYGPVEKVQAYGFQDGDGVKVDIRFANARTSGRCIGDYVNSLNGEWADWIVYKLDDPQTQGLIATDRKTMREFMAGSYKYEDATFTVMQRSDVAGDLILAYTVHPSNPDSRDLTYYARLHEYRGFLIRYRHGKEGRSQPLAAVADTVLENTKRLIDLRFPPKN